MLLALTLSVVPLESKLFDCRQKVAYAFATEAFLLGLLASVGISVTMSQITGTGMFADLQSTCKEVFTHESWINANANKEDLTAPIIDLSRSVRQLMAVWSAKYSSADKTPAEQAEDISIGLQSDYNITVTGDSIFYNLHGTQYLDISCFVPLFSSDGHQVANYLSMTLRNGLTYTDLKSLSLSGGSVILPDRVLDYTVTDNSDSCTVKVGGASKTYPKSTYGNIVGIYPVVWCYGDWLSDDDTTWVNYYSCLYAHFDGRDDRVLTGLPNSVSGGCTLDHAYANFDDLWLDTIHATKAINVVEVDKSVLQQRLADPDAEVFVQVPDNVAEDAKLKANDVVVTTPTYTTNYNVTNKTIQWFGRATDVPAPIDGDYDPVLEGLPHDIVAGFKVTHNDIGVPIELQVTPVDIDTGDFADTPTVYPIDNDTAVPDFGTTAKKLGWDGAVDKPDNPDVPVPTTGSGDVDVPDNPDVPVPTTGTGDVDIPGDTIISKIWHWLTDAPSVPVDLSPLQATGSVFASKFPFCLPFDLLSAFKQFSAGDGTAPVYEFKLALPDVLGGEQMIVLDLSQYNTIAVIFRGGMYLMFLVGLILVTRKIIGAGGG